MSPSRSLTFLNCGGTISSQELVRRAVSAEQWYIGPRSGLIEEIVRYDVSAKVRGLFDEFAFRELPKIKDSSQYQTKDIELIVRSVIDSLKQETGSLIVTCGTDSAATVAQAIAQAVQRELLDLRKIIIAVAQQHPKPNRPTHVHEKFYGDDVESVKTLNNAMYLSTCHELDGDISLLCRNRLYSPRGLLKIDAVGSVPFFSRYSATGEATGTSVPNWGLDDYRPTPNVDRPSGASDQFKLTSGIHTTVLGVCSEYCNHLYSVLGMLRPDLLEAFLEEQIPDFPGSMLPRFEGAILQAPGQASLRINRRDLQYLNAAAIVAAKHGRPHALISDPLQSDIPEHDASLHYEGHMTAIRKIVGDTPIFDGRYLARPEMEIVMGTSLAMADKQGLREQDRVAYFGQSLAEYFKFLEDRRRC